MPKGYIVYDLYAEIVLVSRNNVFHEDSFPFQSSQHDIQDSAFHQTLGMHATSYHLCELIFANSPFADQTLAELPFIEPTPTSKQLNISNSDEIANNSPISHSLLTADYIAKAKTSHFSDPTEPRRMSQSSRHVPRYLDDYQVDSPTHTKSVTSHPISKYLSYYNLSSSHKTFVASLSS